MTEATRRRRRGPRPPLECEVRLLEWGQRGAVDAELDGRVVPIDRGIPGERVVATIDRGRKGRGVVEEVIEPASNRAAPPCPYYLAGCGGCQWQHLSYSGQLEAKRAVVDRELARSGVGCPVDAVHGMEDPWHYRRTAAIAIGWEAGFRPRARRGILEIHDCLISHPSIGSLAAQLNDALRAHRLPNYHGKVWLDCTVVGADDAPTLQVLLQGIEGLTLESHPELPDVAGIIATLDGVGSVAFRHRNGEARPLVGDLMSTIEVAGRPMFLPAGAFFQTNLTMLPRVIDRMRAAVAGRTVRRAADIYGGVGTFALALAGQMEGMTLVELDAQAVEAAERTAAAWGATNVEFVSRHAERALPTLSDLDLVIVDPPRSGLGAVVVEAIHACAVPFVIYLSCSPASLARDLAALQNRGFALQSLEVFDFYPQTYHVESLAILAR